MKIDCMVSVYKYSKVATCCLPFLFGLGGRKVAADGPGGNAFFIGADVALARQPTRISQFAPPDAFENGSTLAYYGSENPWDRRMFSAQQALTNPNRLGQRQLLAVLDKEPERAVEMCQQWLADLPRELESLFVLCVAYCKLDQIDQAVAAAKQAIAAGMPPERFLAGPRELLRPLTEDHRFDDLVPRSKHPLIHGPMLGAVTDSSARFWLRTADAHPVAVRIFASDESEAPVQSAAGATRSETDFTTVLEVAELHPATRYWYDVLVDGQPALRRPHPSFRTYLPRDQHAPFRVGFGGGAGFTPQHERMWDTIASFDLDGFFFLGDNVYIDLPEAPGPFHRYTYYRRQSRPEFRRLTRSTPIYAVWDDHDCAIDDVWMGPYLDKPSWKQPMLALFKQNWNNPAYGDAKWPGCWFRWSIADVDFFFLDGRNYRTNPYGEEPTMLGPVQKAWLLDELKRSRATFKVLVSPVAWATGAKPGSRDTWDGFPREREEIFSSIRANAIEGVFLISADRHRSDAWRIDRHNAYDLYDFMSSRLTNTHTHECLDKALFCYNEQCSFGLLSFDTRAADPTATFTIVNIDGEEIHSLTLKRSQLAFPPR